MHPPHSTPVYTTPQPHSTRASPFPAIPSLSLTHTTLGHLHMQVPPDSCRRCVWEVREALTWLKPFLDLGFCLFSTSVRVSVSASMLESEGKGWQGRLRPGSGPSSQRPSPQPSSPAPSPSSSGFRQALLRLTEVQTFSRLLQRLRPLMAPWKAAQPDPSAQSPRA